MSNSREIMERKMRFYLVGTGDIIMRDPCFPIEIECPDIASVHLSAPGRTYTPNHRNNRRGKFKRSGR